VWKISPDGGKWTKIKAETQPNTFCRVKMLHKEFTTSGRVLGFAFGAVCRGGNGAYLNEDGAIIVCNLAGEKINADSRAVSAIVFLQDPLIHQRCFTNTESEEICKFMR
jgi:hypothetical protein